MSKDELIQDAIVTQAIMKQEEVTKEQEVAQDKPKYPFKNIIAGAVGNTVEWIDWVIYGLASPFIAEQFFPSNDPTVSMLQTFAVYALGFFIRPVGAAIIGPYGDKHGRNKALAISIILMAVSTGAIGLLPTYAQIGIWAPAMILVLRLVQGFAAGGEWGTATAFMYEYAPPHRRAFYSSWRPTGNGVGVFIGGGVITLTTMFFTPETISAWAWRIPFSVAFIVGLIGLYIRTQVDESPEFLKAQANNEISEQPLTDMVKHDKKGLWIVFGLCLVWNVVFFVLFTYMPTYLKTVVHMPLELAMQTNSIATIFYTIMIPIVGWFADKYSKKMFLSICCLGYIFLAYPAFKIIGSGDYMTVLGVQILFALLMAFFSGAVPVVLAEQFPTRTRNTSVSMAYTLNVSLFGGTAPLISTYLVSATGNPIAPAFFMILCTIISYIAVLAIKKD